jgi:two-component system alkaline phosphatase synthesis response regulator PhoP
VLVVEDEEAIAQGLVLNLERKDYEVSLAIDGAQALRMTAEGDFDLILLDVRLPEVDGFEVCRQLRERSDFTPILILTARSQPDDIVYGLKVGADDYVIKPFDLAELLARIEVRLRRQSWKTSGEDVDSENPPLPARVEFGEFWVDFSTFQALTREGVVELSRKEIAVMRIFLSRPKQVITRRELLTQVWELPNHPNTRVVDNVIVALRKSFEENSWRPQHIHSVRGVGYRFTP